MHDVAKRSLALAVAAGGLLITGSAPALAAADHHRETTGDVPGTGQAADGDPAARGVSIPVDGLAAPRGGDLREDVSPDAAPDASGDASVRRPADADSRHADDIASDPIPAAPDLHAASCGDSASIVGGQLLAYDGICPDDADQGTTEVCGAGQTMVFSGDNSADAYCVTGPVGAAAMPSSPVRPAMNWGHPTQTARSVVLPTLPAADEPPALAAPPMGPPMAPDPIPDAPAHEIAAATLPHTGSDVAALAGVGGAALLAGAGAVLAARRKTES